ERRAVGARVRSELRSRRDRAAGAVDADRHAATFDALGGRRRRRARDAGGGGRFPGRATPIWEARRALALPLRAAGRRRGAHAARDRAHAPSEKICQAMSGTKKNFFRLAIARDARCRISLLQTFHITRDSRW